MLAHQFRQVLHGLHHGSARVIPLALVLAGLVTGCDKMALLAPSGTVITFQLAAGGTGTTGSASPAVALNSTIPLTVTVIENGTTSTGTGTGTGTSATSSGAGTPVQNGTVVSFTTTLGTIQPSTATTVNGQVTVQLATGSTPGIAGVTAFSGSAHASLSITVGGTGARTTLAFKTLPSAPAVSTPASFTVTPTPPTGITVTDLTINFGDGTPTLDMGPSSGDTTAVHLYAKAGSYNVSASVTDSTGATITISSAIVVTQLTATVAANPTSVTLASGSSITFTVTPSPTGASIDHYEWDFGDGATTTSGGAIQSHAYSSKGTFTVTVRVVPTAGAAFTITTQASVT